MCLCFHMGGGSWRDRQGAQEENTRLLRWVLLTPRNLLLCSQALHHPGLLQAVEETLAFDAVYGGNSHF